MAMLVLVKQELSSVSAFVVDWLLIRLIVTGPRVVIASALVEGFGVAFRAYWAMTLWRDDHGLAVVIIYLTHNTSMVSCPHEREQHSRNAA